MTKRIEITETDVKFRAGLADILISEGAVPFVFEVSDDFDVNSYEGLSEYKPQAQIVQSFNTKFPEVAAWLQAYRGTFEFYLSLQSQLATKGMLSEKQIACVQRAIEQDKAHGKTVPQGEKREFSLKPGTTLFLSEFISNKIAQAAGYDRGHCVVEVIECEGETPKAYRARIKLSARRTSHCGICGLTLENPESIAAGIGPICAEKVGVSFTGTSLEELELKLSTTAEVTTWIPKSAIKERIEP